MMPNLSKAPETLGLPIQNTTKGLESFHPEHLKQMDIFSYNSQSIQEGTSPQMQIDPVDPLPAAKDEGEPMNGTLFGFNSEPSAPLEREDILVSGEIPNHTPYYPSAKEVGKENNLYGRNQKKETTVVGDFW